ncbi:MAG: hypothetical protein WC291_09855 [Thermodesulfovibrionales bacterium]|jgi:hypothetical protein
MTEKWREVCRYPLKAYNRRKGDSRLRLELTPKGDYEIVEEEPVCHPMEMSELSVRLVHSTHVDGYYVGLYTKGPKERQVALIGLIDSCRFLPQKGFRIERPKNSRLSFKVIKEG